MSCFNLHLNFVVGIRSVIVIVIPYACVYILSRQPTQLSLTMAPFRGELLMMTSKY